MPEDKSKTKDTTGSGESGSGGQPPVAEPPGQDPKTITDPDPSTGTPPAKTFSQQEVEERIQKARQDEKTKVYGQLTEAKKQLKENEKRMAELKASLEQSQGDVASLREGKASEMESVNAELKQLREQNTKLESAIENVASESAAQISALELKAYKERKLRESGISDVLVSTVAGNTREEIDASIESAKKKEDKLRDTLREEVRKEIAKDLPQPIAADGSHGRGPTPVITHQNREALARIKDPQEYKRKRDELLLEAKQKAGLA